MLRGAVSEFRYASAGGEAANVLSIGTVNNDRMAVRVTDILVSNGATAGILTLKVSSYGTYGQPLRMNVPANSIEKINFEIPYKFEIIASTGDTRKFLASVDSATVKYCVSGYIEK